MMMMVVMMVMTPTFPPFFFDLFSPPFGETVFSVVVCCLSVCLSSFSNQILSSHIVSSGSTLLRSLIKLKTTRNNRKRFL